MPIVPRIEPKIEPTLTPTPTITLPAASKITTADASKITTADASKITTAATIKSGLGGTPESPKLFGELAKPDKPIMLDTEQANRALNSAIKIAQQEKERIDHAITTEMDLDLYDSGSKLLKEIKQKYRGSNVVGAENEFLGRWRDIVDETRTKYVKNPELGDAYNTISSHYTKSYLGSVRAHTSAEFDAYETLQFKNKIDNREEQAIKYPAMTETYIQDIKDETIHFAKLRGLGKDWTENSIRNSVGAVHVGVINQLLNNGDYANAQRYFNDHEKEIDKDKVAELGNIIKTQTTFQEAVDTANNIFNANSSDTLENNMKRAYEKSKGKDKSFLETVKSELYGNHARRDLSIKKNVDMARDNVYAYLLKSFEATKVVKISDVPVDVWRKYKELDPENAMALEISIKKMAEKGGDELTPKQKMIQTINWGALASNQEALDKTSWADLSSLVINKQISIGQYESLIKQKNKPDAVKSETIKMVFGKIDKFKFDSDKNKNLREQVRYKDLFARYMDNNYDKPDFDPLGFWEKIAKVKEASWKEAVLDFFSPGQPSVESHKLELEKEAGPGRSRMRGGTTTKMLDRQRAVEILQSKNLVVTERRIEYIIEQLKGKSRGPGVPKGQPSIEEDQNEILLE